MRALVAVELGVGEIEPNIITSIKQIFQKRSLHSLRTSDRIRSKSKTKCWMTNRDGQEIRDGVYVIALRTTPPNSCK